MSDFRRATTARLDLRAMSVADVDELYPIFSDPAAWGYDPGSRHRDRATTQVYAERAGAKWSDGLSYWTVRLIETGEVLGTGGVQRHEPAHWNLNYRLAAAAQGHGYATELARAAVDAAHEHEPDLAVVAWIDRTNTASRRVAERLGLVSQGLHVQRMDGVSRLAYADRPLPAELLAN